MLLYFLCLRQFGLARSIMFLTGLFVRLSVRPSVTNLVNTMFWIKINWFWYILLQIYASGPRGKGMKRSTFCVRRSKVKIRRCWS